MAMLVAASGNLEVSMPTAVVLLMTNSWKSTGRKACPPLRQVCPHVAAGRLPSAMTLPSSTSRRRSIGSFLLGKARQFLLEHRLDLGQDVTIGYPRQVLRRTVEQQEFAQRVFTAGLEDLAMHAFLTGLNASGIGHGYFLLRVERLRP